jgi:hypothetical protein
MILQIRLPTVTMKRQILGADIMANHLNSKQKIPSDTRFNHIFKNTVNSHILENPQLYCPLQQDCQDNLEIKITVSRP